MPPNRVITEVPQTIGEQRECCGLTDTKRRWSAGSASFPKTAVSLIAETALHTPSFPGGVKPPGGSARLAEQRIEAEKALVLLERIAIGHAGDEIADLAGLAHLVGEIAFLAPALRH